MDYCYYDIGHLLDTNGSELALALDNSFVCISRCKTSDFDNDNKDKGWGRGGDGACH